MNKGRGIFVRVFRRLYNFFMRTFYANCMREAQQNGWELPLRYFRRKMNQFK